MLAGARAYLPRRVVDGLKLARRRYWQARSLLTPPVPDQPPRPRPPQSAVRLLVGPANFAGQAWHWGRAAERHLPDVSAVVLSVDRGGLQFASDYAVPVRLYRSYRWQREQQDHVLRDFTHVLIDAMRPVFGPRYAEDCAPELPLLRRAGLRVGLVAHGSDIRLGSLHRELYPHSPWQDGRWERGRVLQQQAERLGGIFTSFDGPTFVSTPDLLDFAPRARWLPVVVDSERWRNDRPVLQRARPVVVHAPSNPHLKGSHVIDPVLQGLSDRGWIEYRRLAGVPPEQMPAVVADADVLIDQVLLGLYSVAAVEAMAAGRVVLAHVHPRVRARVPADLPVLEASPDDLREAVERILADRDTARATAGRGPGYVARVHDGRWSAAVLADFLGVASPRASAESRSGR